MPNISPTFNPSLIFRWYFKLDYLSTETYYIIPLCSNYRITYDVRFSYAYFLFVDQSIGIDLTKVQCKTCLTVCSKVEPNNHTDIITDIAKNNEINLYPFKWTFQEIN